VIGSNLWSWHWAHDIVSPSQVVAVASTRSNIETQRFSSGIAPPSPFSRWLRRNAVPIRVSSLASGSRSPASIAVESASYGVSRFSSRTSQSRQSHWKVSPSC
jgi:hypothetical protein